MTNCYRLNEGFVSQIVIIRNFVVVSSVGIMRVVCMYFNQAILETDSSDVFKGTYTFTIFTRAPIV